MVLIEVVQYSTKVKYIDIHTLALCLRKFLFKVLLFFKSIKGSYSNLRTKIFENPKNFRVLKYTYMLEAHKLYLCSTHLLGPVLDPCVYLVYINILFLVWDILLKAYFI